MAKTLLSMAESTHANSRSKPVTPEEMEMALAWARGEINLAQASRAYSARNNIKHGMGVYTLLARALRTYIQENNL